MKTKIDTYEVNQRADLLSMLSGADLKRKATTGGGEWKGPCPFCGGVDRFSVQPYNRPQPRWMCRRCTGGKWQDAIELGRRLWPGLKFPEICERIAGGNLPQRGAGNLRKPEPTPAYSPPPVEWQGLAREAVAECEARLWKPEGQKALDYLRRRGLQDKTIKRFRLGFNPEGRRLAGEYWLDRGITIPCEVAGEMWYLKVRTPYKDPKRKYRLMAGSRPAAIFNADNLGDPLNPALFVEGEFDCMLCHQEILDLVPAATLGSASNRPDLATWGRYLTPHKVLMLAYDTDQAGESGAAALASISDRAVLALLPAGEWKDITDYYLAGGNLSEWILPYLIYYAPLEAASAVEEAQLLGGVMVTELQGV